MKKKNERPGTFEEFREQTIGNEYSQKYVIPREKWMKESKAAMILDKIPIAELPEAENLDPDHSKVGDFISNGDFEDLYDDDGELLDALGDKGLLCYCSMLDVKTWWKIKKDEDGDGLVRIK